MKKREGGRGVKLWIKIIKEDAILTANASILYKQLMAFTHAIVLLKEPATCNSTLGRLCYIKINSNAGNWYYFKFGLDAHFLVS